MIRSVYLIIGRGISPLFIVGLWAYTFFTRTERVRVMVFNERGDVLLLRGVVSDGKWSLPGGGVEKGETATAAASRELYEETGIRVRQTDLRYLTTLARPDIRVNFKVPLFTVTVNAADLPERHTNKWEIAGVEWFDLRALPDSLSLVARVALDVYNASR